MKLRFILIGALLAGLSVVSSGTRVKVPAPPESGSPMSERRIITDMAGRTVALPAQVERVATIGPVPVINSFIFALGEGQKIVNGLPDFARTPRFKYQSIFVHGISEKPVLQGPALEPDMEAILKASPDVVLTMNLQTARILEKNGVPAVFLSFRPVEDLKNAVRLLGEILGRQNRAEAYIGYYENTLRRVARLTARIPADKRVRVLFCHLKRLTQPHLVVDWWIEKAGGISVTNDGRKAQSVTFNIEQMYRWNPDVLVVAMPKEAGEAYGDARFSGLKAIKEKRVYVTPMGAMPWAHNTSEEPLMVLWAAKTFYPEEFRDINLMKEARYFYERFFNHSMQEKELREVLDGLPG